MKKLSVFDPAMCCSTGVCGPDPDQALIDFASDFDWLKAHGVPAERWNLANQPMAFVLNHKASAFLRGPMPSPSSSLITKSGSRAGTPAGVSCPSGSAFR